MADEMTYYDSPLTGEELDAAFRKIPQIDADVQQAAQSVVLSQSWAEGNTGTREGENENNAKYWCGKAQQATQFDPQNYYTRTQSDARYQFPIGYIFDWLPMEGQQTDLTTPEKVAEYFGYGTWQEISGRFTFGRAEGYEAGSTGGETAHKLSVDELPNYSLSQGGSYRKGACLAQTYNGIQLSESTNDGAIPSLGINSKGKDKAHNNMPPYLTVYKWQRIA